MMRHRSWIPIILLAGVVSAPWAQTLPPASEARAERYDEWRSSIRTAERAVAHGRFAEASDIYRRIVDEAASTDDRSLLHARALDGLAALQLRQGNFAEAERLYLRCIPLWERLLGADQPRLAVTLNNLALARVRSGNCDGARDSYERALSILAAAGEHGAEGTGAARDALAQLDRRCRASR